LVTSCVYVVNDIIDAPQDKLHPFKKKRPISSGDLSVSAATFFAIAGFFTSIYLAWTTSTFFLAIILFYILLHTFYSLKLKHQPILDVFAIAAGFILRVY